MRRVDVQDVIEQPRATVSVRGHIHTRVVRLDRRVGDSGNGFLDVAHA